MATLKHRLQFISEGGAVVRNHTRMGIKQNTDAHHSHGVAMLCSILAGESPVTGHTEASSTLLMAACSHDLAEQVASDVSTPAKSLMGIGMLVADVERGYLARYGVEYESLLTTEEALILSLADQFDYMLYLCRELSLGNRNVLLPWHKKIAYLENHYFKEADTSAELTTRSYAMYRSIIEIFKETQSENGPSFDVYA